MKDDKQIVSFHEKIIQNFIESKRPPINIRDQVDIGYSIKDQVVEIFEIRPIWNDKGNKITIPVAKSRFIKSRSIWKVYWNRANGNWDLYKPMEEVKDLSEFLKIVDEDKFGCFWG